ncbi:hypothetical protein [Yoonia sp. 208BN28-4]|uniref:hypothetical protein n=1 Tax=Yoonia sp. 208BN28-4 TaxID=3126505 RepID=UPI0030ABAAB4
MILALALAASPAVAESPMTGDAFEAYTAGRTLTFSTPTTPNFGTEMYLSDRRVLWSTIPGECTTGVWYDQGRDICFVYENDPEPKCWEIYKETDGLRAVFTTRPDTSIIFEKVEDAKPLVCNNLAS